MKVNSPRRKRIPIVLLLATLIVCALIYAAHRYQDELSDTLFAFDFAILNIIKGGVAALFSVLWLGWLWFRSGWSAIWSRILPTLAVVFGVGFLVCYKPIITGGMGIDRWEPRFWVSRTIELTTDNKRADFASQTEYDFPQFFGRHRNGVVDTFGATLVDLEEQCSVVWKKPIGQGWSGFACSNGFAVTSQQVGADEVVSCIDIQTGLPHWTYRHKRRHEDFLGGVGPRSTPTISDGKVYFNGANGLLVCLNADTGELIWKQDLTELLNISLIASTNGAGISMQTENTNVTWGRAGSPLVYKDLVIVPAGGGQGQDPASLIAFDAKTGQEKWRGGEDDIGYSSPTIATLAGKEQILIVNEATVSGHDPETGQTLWTHPWPGHSNQDANTSQANDIGNDRVLVSKGYGVGGELLQVKRDSSGEFTVVSLWKNQRVLKTKLTSALVKDKYAYALNDGILECVELETGKRVWKRGRYGHGQVLLIGDKLLVHAERGFLALVDATPDGFKEHGRFDTIDGICWNTICVYNQYVLVRSELEAACILVSDP